MKHLLCLSEWTTKDILETLDMADRLKYESRNGIPHNHLLQGKTLGLIFTKSSTRTRVSFEVGMVQLGGYPLFLSSADIQLGRGETVSDTAKVLSRYLDGIMIRTFAQSDVEGLAQHGTIPIINGLTDLQHPCQVLADLQTIREKKGTLVGLKLAYVGDGNNMANSLLIGCAKVGMHISVANPVGFDPDAASVDIAHNVAAETGSTIVLTHSAAEAVQDADVVYTDTWVSMGQEAEKAARVKQFGGFQVDDALMSKAKPDAIFLHCLPAYREYEVTASVIDGPQSVVFDEAENRLHAQKSVLVKLMG